MTKTACVFPGQGSQSVGMLKELAETSPIIEATFKEASDALGYDLWDLVQNDTDGKLNETHITQPALLAAMQKSDLDWLVPHQANFRIIKATAKKLNMSLDQVVLTLEQYGNTSAATVPTALDTAIRDRRIQRGQHLLLEAFGGGFAWASALVRY